MRWLHTAVIVLFAVSIVLFAVQNFQTITIDFLGLSFRLPFALLVVVAYLLGMATGGSLISLLRRAIEGSRRRTSAPRS